MVKVTISGAGDICLSGLQYREIISLSAHCSIITFAKQLDRQNTFLYIPQVQQQTLLRV